MRAVRPTMSVCSGTLIVPSISPSKRRSSLAVISPLIRSDSPAMLASNSPAGPRPGRDVSGPRAVRAPPCARRGPSIFRRLRAAFLRWDVGAMTPEDDFVRGPAGRVGGRRRRTVRVIVFTVWVALVVATHVLRAWRPDPGPDPGEQRIAIVRPDG